MIHGPALLIVVIGATAGRMALLQKNGSTNQQITSFELNSNLVHPVFVLEQAGCAEHWLRATASTATIPILDADVVSRLSVAVPPIEEQSGVVEYLNNTTPTIDAAIARAHRQIELTPGVPHPPHRRRGYRQAGRPRGSGPVARRARRPGPATGGRSAGRRHGRRPPRPRRVRRRVGNAEQHALSCEAQFL